MSKQPMRHPATDAPSDDPAASWPSPPEHVADPRSLDEEGRARIEEFAFRYGRSYDSYLVTDMEREYFWSSGKRGLVSFVSWGKHVVAIGGLLAPEEHWAELVREVLAFVRRRRCTLTFYNIDPQQAATFRAAGFQITKIGEDALMDLTACTWKGADYEWVRRQSSYCLRHGLVCQELAPRDVSAPTDTRAERLTPEICRELLEISRHFLQGRPNGEHLRYFVSRFDPAKLYRQRLFVARAEGGRGRIDAFIVCNPGRDGRLWSIEVYRQRHGAVRGSVPFLMHQAMRRLQEEGTPLASLCLVPTLRCDRPLPGDSRLGRRLALLHKYTSAVYDTSGLFHFKSRFRPRFEDRFACVWPGMTLMSILAGLMLLGIHRFDPVLLVSRILQQVRKRKSRAGLAKPAA